MRLSVRRFCTEMVTRANSVSAHLMRVPIETEMNALPRRAARKRLALRRGLPLKPGATKSTPLMPEVAGVTPGGSVTTLPSALVTVNVPSGLRTTVVPPGPGTGVPPPVPPPPLPGCHRRRPGPPGAAEAEARPGPFGSPLPPPLASTPAPPTEAMPVGRRSTLPPVTSDFAPVSRSTWITAPPAVGHHEVAVGLDVDRVRVVERRAGGEHGLGAGRG